MASALELRAADLLAIVLEKEGLLLNSRLLRIFPKLGPEELTQRAIEERLRTEISSSVGRIWGRQIAFLRASLGLAEDEPLTVKALRWPEIYQRNTQMAQKILKDRNFQALADAGTVLNDVIVRQVDETQQLVGAQRGVRWERHTDAGACSWCTEQVANYRENRVWLRHANCRCFRVRSDDNGIL